MRIDENILAQARTADVLAFFEKYNGFTFAHQSGAYRCQQHKSFAVKSDRRSFYWHSKSVGGYGVLDYLMKVEGLPFHDAVESVMGGQFAYSPLNPQIRPVAESPKTLILPERAGVQLRLYDYLCNKRGIDKEIIDTLIQKEMLYEDKRGNIVFIGYDEHNKPRFACLRGTHGDFRGDCTGSDKRYSFAVAAYTPFEVLYIYESGLCEAQHKADYAKKVFMQSKTRRCSITTYTAG